MTVARKGIGALSIAYVILFLLIAAVLAVVLLGHDKNEAVVSLHTPAPIPARADKPSAPSTATSAMPLPPAPKPETAPAAAAAAIAIPPETPAKPPQSAAVDATPAPSPPAATPPAASAPPSPQASAAATPEKPADSAPPRASLYPPPPPEKPPVPARTAAKAPDVAAAPDAPPGRPLAPAALQEAGPYGPLPRIAPDGRLPWIINNSRFDHGTRKPRLGIVVTGLGLSPQVTEDAIIQLPAEVTLAFVPYAEDLPRWIKLARQFGHEVLLSLPLEGGDVADPGLGARMLSTQVSAAENLDRLRWLLSRSSGYVGVVTWEGERLLSSGQAVPILQEIAQRGLLIVDSRQARSNVVQQQAEPLGLPFAKSRGFLDSEAGVAALDRNLQQLEAITQRSGFGVAMAVAFPDTVKRLVDWSKTVGQRGFVLAPITGVTECKDICQQRVARHGEAVSAARR